MTIDIEQVARVIPLGHDNAKNLSEMVSIFESHGWLSDMSVSNRERRTRDIISRVRMDYVICNIQDGKGYFRPTKEDLEALRKYTEQEKSRAKEIGRRARLGESLLMDFYKERCHEQRLD